jgi:diketogulonate reductase-like aldo/keto reductase
MPNQGGNSLADKKPIPGGGQIPTIGLGTWQIGGRMTPDTTQDAQIERVFHDALDLGYRHFDTAEMYGGGHTETLLGQALSGFPRHELFLTSKVWQDNLRQAEVRRACEGSLQRLGTEYLDLYLIHWPNPSVPLEETFAGLNALVAEGLVRRLGVSNFDLPLLRQAVAHSETPLANLQAPYSLHNRQYVDNGALAFCQENGILFTAYTPVERGRVASDPVVGNIASRLGASPIQVALAWLVHQPQVIAIPMSKNSQHLRENLAASQIELSQTDRQRLDVTA